MSTPKPWLLVLLIGVFCFPPVLYAGCDKFSAKTLNSKASPYQQVISQAARKYKVSQALIKAVITAESCFNETAVSPREAAGLMQLMPDTAERFGVINVFDPAENIDAGTRYLRWLLKRYQGSITHVIAAYNAGEGRIDHGEPVTISFKETRGYIRRVLTVLGKLEETDAAREEAQTLLADWDAFERGETPDSAKPFVRGGKVMLASLPEMLVSSAKVMPIPVETPPSLDPCDQVPLTILHQAFQRRQGSNVTFYYRAEAGESLFNAADKLGIHIGDILLLNDSSADDILKAGQMLKVAECTKAAG